MGKVVGIVCIKNDRDIVEPFIRHNLAHLDALWILDNGSTDGTYEVIEKLRDEGLPLHVSVDPTVGYYQSARMTKLATMAAETSAEWIITLDADELIEVDTDAPLRELLAGLPGEVAQWPWSMFALDPSDDVTEPNPITRIRHRVRNYPQPWCKILFRSAVARQPGFCIPAGSHGLVGYDRPVPRLENARLAHFAIRGSTQYALKCITAYLQFVALGDDAPADRGFQNVELFQRALADIDQIEATLYECSSKYAVLPQLADFVPHLEDRPLKYLGGPLKHPGPLPTRATLTTSLLLFAEALATQVGKLSQATGRAQHEVAQWRGRVDYYENAERQVVREHEARQKELLDRTHAAEQQLAAVEARLVEIEGSPLFQLQRMTARARGAISQRLRR